jgi:hypothetical protein
MQRRLRLQQSSHVDEAGVVDHAHLGHGHHGLGEHHLEEARCGDDDGHELELELELELEHDHGHEHARRAASVYDN